MVHTQLECIYTLQLSQCQGNLCWKQARYVEVLSDCNVTRTYKHLVGKLTPNHQRVIVYELSGCWFQSGFSQKTNETN